MVSNNFISLDSLITNILVPFLQVTFRITLEYLCKTIWYKIDAFTHGSVAIYKSKEAYEAFMELNAVQRDFAADERKVFM